MPWPSCSPYRQNTPTGAQRCPKAYATAPRPRHSKPWSTSISMLSQTSTCRADTDATEKGTMKHHKGLASFNPNQRRLSAYVKFQAATVAFEANIHRLVHRGGGLSNSGSMNGMFLVKVPTAMNGHPSRPGTT